MKSDYPHVSIIILNWNGWKDTIECLETVLKSSYPAYHIILVDNCSADDSVKNIIKWAAGEQPWHISSNFPELVFPEQSKPIPMYRYTIPGSGITEESSEENLQHGTILLVENQQNIGFAAGNNLGMEIGKKLFDSKYIYLLNNDTVIEPQTMRILVDSLQGDSRIGAVTSAIYHYSDADRIVNLGGKLLWWGTQKYHESRQGTRLRRVTFSTGCSLMIRREVIDTYGPLSDLFFFGEEDFEFSLRLRKNGIRMACAPQSKIYHKESVSSQKLYNRVIKKKFIHIFNRFIDMKHLYPLPVYVVWRWLVIVLYFFWLIFKHGEKAGTALKFSRALRRYTHKFHDARKSTIDIIYSELSL